MKPLEDVEHRAVFIVEESARYVNPKPRVDADEILIEGAMVDGAEAETVAHEWLAERIGVADDVRGIEKPYLAEPADSAPIAVGRQDRTPELRLVDALLDLADDMGHAARGS